MSTDSVSPDDWAAMTEDEREQYAAERERELHASLEADAQELTADQEAAIDALEDPVEERLTEVDLGRGVTVDVKTHLSEAIEEKLERVEANTNDLSAVRSELVECLAWLIEDDQYGDPMVWREYARRYGLTELAPKFFHAIEPALDRVEEDAAVQRFRED